MHITYQTLSGTIVYNCIIGTTSLVWLELAEMMDLEILFIIDMELSSHFASTLNLQIWMI